MKNSRYYDPTRTRFISPDNIAPPPPPQARALASRVHAPHQLESNSTAAHPTTLTSPPYPVTPAAL
jgi:hypothetical protein